MSNFCHRFDALGTIVGFRIDGNNRKRSFLGSFLTITIVITSFLTLGFFGVKYINREEIYQKNFIQNYAKGQEIQLDSSSFLFATSFNTRNNALYNSSWSLKMLYISYDLDTQTVIEKRDIPSKFCTKKDWTGVEEEFELKSISKGSCYDVEGLILKGNNHYGVVSKIELSLSLDTNVIQNNSLLKILENETSIAPPVLNFYYYNSLFSNNKGNGTITRFIDTYSYEIHPNTYKESLLYVSRDELTTIEDKVLINEKSTLTAYVTKFTSEKSMVRNSTSEINFVLDVFPSTTKNITEYSYMTFSEMIARIGGIINILILFFQLIVYVKNFLEFEFKMTKKYFNKINEDITINQNPNKSWVDKRKSNLLKILNRSDNYKSNINSNCNINSSSNCNVNSIINEENNIVCSSPSIMNRVGNYFNNNYSKQPTIIKGIKNKLSSKVNSNNTNPVFDSFKSKEDDDVVKFQKNNLVNSSEINQLKQLNQINEINEDEDYSRHMVNAKNDDINVMNNINYNNNNRIRNNKVSNNILNVNSNDPLKSQSDTKLRTVIDKNDNNGDNESIDDSEGMVAERILNINNANNNANSNTNVNNNNFNNKFNNVNNIFINNVENKNNADVKIGKLKLENSNKNKNNVKVKNVNLNAEQNNIKPFSNNFLHQLILAENKDNKDCNSSSINYNNVSNNNDNNLNKDNSSDGGYPRYTKYGTLPTKVKTVSFF